MHNRRERIDTRRRNDSKIARACSCVASRHAAAAAVLGACRHPFPRSAGSSGSATSSSHVNENVANEHTDKTTSPREFHDGDDIAETTVAKSVAKT